MRDGFKILDSDMHLREPANLWDKYMEPEWREQAPKILSSTARSSAMVMIEGKILQGYKPAYRGGIFDATRIDEEIKDYRASGFDAKTQLLAMDREGLDVAALYPSIGLGIMMRSEMDPGLAAAIARASGTVRDLRVVTARQRADPGAGWAPAPLCGSLVAARLVPR